MNHSHVVQQLEKKLQIPDDHAAMAAEELADISGSFY